MPARAESTRAAWAVLVVLSATAVWCATELTLGLSNTFHHSGRWITSKSFLERGAIGGVMFRVSRVGLARNRVDLGAWFGFHEIIWHEPLPLSALEFSFRLDDAAWLAVLFNGERHDFDVVRLSRDPELPSLAARVDRKRLFLEPAYLDDPRIGPGWHRGRVEFAPDSYRMLVDGVIVDERPIALNVPQRFGFKGGGASAEVDDVVMRCPGEPDRVETFSNRRGILSTLTAVTALLLGLHTIVFAVLRRRRLRRPALVYHLVVAALVAIGAALAYAMDRAWVSLRYPKNVLVTPHYPNTIVFEPDPVPLAASNPTGEVYRIMFVGSSQTWGSGAILESDTWVRVVERTLNARSDLGRRFECVNTGISGATSTSLLARYRDEWLESAPDLTVVNLSHNDQIVQVFGLNLAEFARLSRDAGVGIVFLLEPNSHQPTMVGTSSRLENNHTVIRWLCEEFDLRYIDMQAKMFEDRNRGFLWWDPVHLTSAGQAVFAENLVEELLPLLPR